MQAQQNKTGIGEAVVLESPVAVREPSRRDAATRAAFPQIGLFTGGQDRHYALGLGMALLTQDLALDVIGSDEIDGPEFHADDRLQFRNLHGGQKGSSLAGRIGRVLKFYARLAQYILTAKPKIFHILWNNKVPIVDRTALMLFYKLAAKKVVLTAHNVNAAKRDKRDSWLNRITLRCQYRLADHLFVHTRTMKDELVHEFGIDSKKITVIPYGINNAVPYSALSREEARRDLGLRNDDKVILYFGAIKQYKGLEYLVAAFQQIAAHGYYRLIIAGERKKGYEEYWRSIQQAIDHGPGGEKVLRKVEFIPDSEIEIYFKSADVAILPYTDIFQSGVLFLAFAYGLPVIATDVGSFSEDIVQGVTGFVCKPEDSGDLAAAIERYFMSDLYMELGNRREEIRDYFFSTHSWDLVAKLTKDVYSQLLWPLS